MENAVKALLMAAGVLIGVLILSLAVTLYSALSSYAEGINKDIEQKELDKFNTQFMTYIKDDLTIQDVVTVANMAYENNLKYGLEHPGATLDESSYYVEVKIGEDPIESTIHQEAPTLLKDNLNVTYRCTNDNIQYSKITGRVISIKFVENSI